jgi:NAD(P)-dependent dehydrogenase (short-subunit alcohol dehydrogenase family)
MKIEFNGKTAIVSGSTSGIGFAIGLGLARSGARVILNGRHEYRVEKAVAQLRALAPGADVSGIAADLANAKGVEDFIAAAGPADIVVNNLGIFEPKSFRDISDADWLRFFETNVLSGIRLSRKYLPSMIARNWGRIIFISSESALNTPPEMIHYGMTKTAQLAVSRGLAELTAGTGVTVNSVLPGPTRSEGVGDFFRQMAEDEGITQAEMEARFIAEHRPSSLLKRLADVEEVANMVVYLCSIQASATNGAAVRVDGGVVKTIA